MTSVKKLIRSSVIIGLILPPFLLGGVYSHIGTNLLIMGILSFLGIIYSIHSLIYKKQSNISLMILPLVLLISYILFQLIPLPMGLLEILSPKTAFFHGIEGSGSHPLTLSVPDSWYTIFRLLTIGIFASMISGNFSSDLSKWRKIIIRSIIGISSIVIVISIVFRLLQFKTWLYGTLGHPGFLLDPIIINPNHAAGYFGISGILSLFMLAKNEHRRKKIFYGSLFFLHSLAVAGTLSRGGILAYTLSVLFFLVISRYSFIKNRKNLLMLFIPLLLILSTVFYTGFSLLEKEFDVEREGFFNKVENYHNVVEYSSDFFLTGSGAGSFSKVYTYYQKNPETRFVELENEPVQFFLEYGLFSLVIFALLLFIVLKKKKTDRRYKGYYAVFFFVFLHNTVDFNLHDLAILFPVSILLILSSDYVKLSGRKLKTFYSILLFTALLVFATSISSAGHKLVGFEKETDYNKKVYLHPAHYLVPMEKTIEQINSPLIKENINATQTVSALISKAPNYYFSYFLAGNIMLQIGAKQESIEFFKQSLEKCDKNLYKTFKKINRILKNNGLKEYIPEVIPQKHEHISDLERLLVKESLTNVFLETFISNKQDLFPIGSATIFIRKKEYATAKSMIFEINKKVQDPKIKGELLVLSGRIEFAEKNYENAYRKYLEGASLTKSFSYYLLAAYCSLKLGKKEMENAESNLKKLSLYSNGSLASYYIWKHKKELLAKNISRALKSLEKAASISREPNIKRNLAYFYYRNGLYSQALLEVKEIVRKHPKYRSAEMHRFIKKINDLISKHEIDIIKDSLLNK